MRGMSRSVGCRLRAPHPAGRHGHRLRRSRFLGIRPAVVAEGRHATFVRCHEDRQIYRENAPYTNLALKADLATQQPGQLSADRKAKAGSAIFTARAAVDLRERLKDRGLLLYRDADAGVDDFERDDLGGAVQVFVGRAPARGHRLGDELYLTLLGELERVAEQVVEDLLQALRVGR